MTPRNPDRSSEETVQDKTLQVGHEGINDETSAQAEPVQQDAPVGAIQREEMRSKEAELDRVEIYLKGPTAFAA